MTGTEKKMESKLKPMELDSHPRPGQVIKQTGYLQLGIH